MNIRWICLSILVLTAILIGCDGTTNAPIEAPDEQVENPAPIGDPVVKITVDWDAFESTIGVSKSASFTLSDTITHFGIRLIYPDENAAFSQSILKNTAEEKGIITMNVPAADQAFMYSVAVRKTEIEEQAFLLGTMHDLMIEAGQEYNWTVDDFSWVQADWIPSDALQQEFEDGVFTTSKDEEVFEFRYLVTNPFDTSSEIEYADLFIKLNGIGSAGEFENGLKEYVVRAENPDPGAVNESSHNFYPYLDSQKFNLPGGRYIIGEAGQFIVKWE